MRQNQGTLFGRPYSDPLNVILIANCFVFLLQLFANQQLIFRFGLIPQLVWHGSVWQVFTYGFLHATEGILPFHLLFNMYGFYILGNYIEPVFGKWKFLLLYFYSQLGGGILVLFSAFLNQSLGGTVPLLDQPDVPTIGASGAVFGLLAVFGLINPESDIFLLFFRVKAKNAVWVSLGVGYCIDFFGSGGISNTCHLGGALTGIGLFQIWKRQVHLPDLILPNENKKVEPNAWQDHFVQQKKENEEILKTLHSLKSTSEKLTFLMPKQVENANICPPPTYNSQDEFCIRCEWLPNCALRKEKDV